MLPREVFHKLFCPATAGRLTGAVVALLLVAGCASRSPLPEPAAASPAPPVPASRQSRTVGEKAAVAAVRQVGIPYRYGGTGPRGFDCSGLVQFAYSQAGARVPRTTSALWQALRPVNRLQTGDVLFFRIDGKMSHVGLYLGDRRFVHAPSSGKTVTVASLDAPFYRDAFIRAGRP